MICRVLAVSASLVALSCGDWKPNRQIVTPSQPVDQVTITAAQPPGGSVLAPGSAVTLKVTFTYRLETGDTASIQMVLADQEHRVLNRPGDYPTASVTRGSGTAELSYSMTLPSSGVTSVVVNLPMLVGTRTSSQPMDAIQYSVK